MAGMFESTINKVRTLFAVNAFAATAYVLVFGITVNQLVIAFVIFFLMNGVGVVVGFHRYYSHNSFKFKHSIYEYLTLLVGSLSGSGSTLGWAGIHRAHHKYSDTDRDPHSAERGFWSMLSLNYNQDFSPRLVVDLYKNRLVMWFHKYYYIPILIYVSTLLVVFGISGVVIGFCLPAALTVAAEGATNYVNHKEGDEYAASNVWWMNMFSFGDGWHKNHHDKPTAWTTREEWYQIDIMGVFIEKVLADKGSL
jgi:fatty-acid desaturase